MQAANFYTVDIEKHSMGVGLRCWPTNQDYNNGKDCSASVATHANEAAGAGDLEVHCSADSLHQGSAPAGMAALQPLAARAPRMSPARHPPRRWSPATPGAANTCSLHSQAAPCCLYMVS